MMRHPKISNSTAVEPAGSRPRAEAPWHYCDDSVDNMLRDRRRLWTTATLIGCGLAAVLLWGGYVATRAFESAAPGTITVSELRLAPSLTNPAPPVDLGPPLMTGSLPPGVGGAVQPEQNLNPEKSPAIRQARAIANRRAVSSSLLTLPLPFSRRQQADAPTVLKTPDTYRLASLTGGLRLAPAANPVTAPAPARQTIIVANGDTLSGILTRFGIDQTEIAAMMGAMQPVFPPGRLRAGQELSLTLGKASDGATVPMALILESDGREISVSRTRQRKYVASSQGGEPLTGAPAQTRKVARIYGSFYQTARQQKIPNTVITRMMRTHSYDVDFQRQIKAGDPFEVFYSGGGGFASKSRAKLLYSSLTTAGKKRDYYRFTTPDGVTDFYNPGGASSQKPLMRTPLNGARVSSPFGMRKHPVLGYTKMHTGTDFAAPRGTPVFAAGDGVIERAGRNGSFGVYVRMRHSKGLVTAYAHLQKIAKGIRPGTRVRQGQIIAFVGSSGRSTGPHLHFEVAVNGKKKNPLTVKVAGTGRRLAGKTLARFKAEKSRIDRLRRQAPVSTLVAAAKF